MRCTLIEFGEQKGDGSQLCAAVPANKIENFKEAFGSLVFLKSCPDSSLKAKDKSPFLEIPTTMVAFFNLGVEVPHLSMKLLSTYQEHPSSLASIMWRNKPPPNTSPLLFLMSQLGTGSSRIVSAGKTQLSSTCFSSSSSRVQDSGKEAETHEHLFRASLVESKSHSQFQSLNR